MRQQVISRPRLIVTGLTGLIGGRVRALLAQRYDLIDFSRSAGLDITDRRQLEAAAQKNLENVAALAHLAAYTDVSRAHAQTGDKNGPCYKINVVGTENVARLCAERGWHLIHLSTDFIFDGTKPAREGPYVETDQPKPIEWYGRTKLMSEEAVRRIGSWTILRTGFPYVPGPARRPDLVQGIYLKLLAGADVHLFNDQVITPTFGDDVAQGIGLVARVQPRGELFHLAGSSPVTPFDLGLKIARAFNFDQQHVIPGSMKEYLKKDPRPRHQRLHVGNVKWSAFAERNGLDRPMTIDVGLARVVRDQPSPVKSERSNAE